MDKGAAVLIVGHGDVIETSLSQYFRAQGFSRVVSSTEVRLDVLDRASVDRFFDAEKIAYVVMGSVRSGGIGANQAHPAEFIFENLQAQNNIIDASFRKGVKKFLYLAASCVYPKDCPQPMKEAYFLTGAMEKTSEPYSLSKAAGIVMCQAYRQQYGFPAIVAVPATVYGPSVGEDPQDAHVMGALMHKFREALRLGSSEIELWGTGAPRREFIFGDDVAAACLFLLEHYDAPDLVNLGTGEDISIKELAALIKAVSGFKGDVRWNTAKPDGVMKKLLDSSRLLALGWRPKTGLAEGVRFAYKV